MAALTNSVIVVVCLHLLAVSAMEPPKGIDENMFCNGCEMVIKELNSELKDKPAHGGVEKLVTKTLKTLCDTERYKQHEKTYEKIVKVCKHLRDHKDFAPALMNEYDRKHKFGLDFSYLEMTQTICGTVLKACPSVSFFGDSEEDGGIVFNRDTQDFEIKYGKKVKVAGSAGNQQGAPDRENKSQKQEAEKPTRVETPADSKPRHTHDEF